MMPAPRKYANITVRQAYKMAVVQGVMHTGNKIATMRGVRKIHKITLREIVAVTSKVVRDFMAEDAEVSQ
jgi:hypothetical protein